MREMNHCPACGAQRGITSTTSRTTRDPSDPHRWTLKKCRACRHGFLDPQPTMEDLEPYYTASYSAYQPNHGIDGDYAAVVAEAKRTRTYRHLKFNEGQRILDVGSGGGSFLSVMRDVGVEGYGVEPATTAAEQARERGLRVHCGTLESYVDHAPPGGFDRVTFSHVLEHVPDPVATLRIARSLLAPDGRIWISVPNGDCAAARHLAWRWHSTDLPVHLHHFSLDSLRLIVASAMLDVHSMMTYSLPSAVRSTLLLFARHRIHMPRRIVSPWLTERLASRIGARMDARHRGEAIIAEFSAHLPSAVESP